MDGTIYRLYDVPNWLERLRAEDETVYDVKSYERKSLKHIRGAVQALIARGVNVGILTWCAMDGANAFNERTLQAKWNWARRLFPELVNGGNFRGMPYGTPKHEIAYNVDPDAIHILVDDNNEVRKHWRAMGKNFHAINAKKGFIKQLLFIGIGN